MDQLVQRRGAGETRWTMLLVALLLAATAYGGYRAVSSMNAIHDPAALGGDAPATLRLGDARVEVVAAEEVVGVAGSDLMGGMGHNISGWVKADQMMVQVWLRVSTGDRPGDYDPTQLRAYATGSPTPILPASGSLGTGTLTPHSMVEGSVSFVVPRTETRLSLSSTTSGYSIDIPAVAGSPAPAVTPAPGDDEPHH